MTSFINYFFKILAFFLATITFLAILSLIISFIFKKDNKDFSFYSGNQNSNEKIAILKLAGPIISEPHNISKINFLSSLEAIYPSKIKDYLQTLKKENIKGLIISINSPGGSVSATNSVYELISKFKKQLNIPIYFHSSELLASGGYWMSLSGDMIFASYGSLIGSIGVKGPDWIYYNSPTSLSSGILGNSVESPNEIKLFSNNAGISKDIFNPFRKPTNREILKLQKMVDDIYEDFVNLVSNKRKIEKEIIKNEINAMIFNAKQAKANFLINEVINLEKVLAILIKKLDLKDPKIITNQKNLNYNLISLNFFSELLKNKNYNKNNLIIKKKYCNNIANEFSTIFYSSYYLNC